MLLSSSHEAPDRHHRCLHDTQLPVAGKEGPVAEQEGHGARHLGLRLIVNNTRYLVAGCSRVKPYRLPA